MYSGGHSNDGREHPSPTCKGVSIKDHVFVSPELAMYLRDIWVDDSFFKDHAALAATFDSLGKPPMLPLWKQPQPIEWKEVPSIQDEQVEVPSAQSMDQQYQRIFESLEAVVDQKLRQANKQPLLPKQKGRAATYEVHFQQEFSQPPKPARQGERQPMFHGIDSTHHRWLRQARRLCNLAKNLSREIRNQQQQQHAVKLWYSILKAPGFAPNFAAWWNQNQGNQAVLTEAVPSATTATLVAAVFEEKLTALEKALLQHRISSAKQRRKDDVNVIFRDLRKESPKPCTTLLQTIRARVVAVDVDDFSVEVQPPQTWKADQQLWTHQGPFDIIHAEPDKLWLSSDPAELMGTEIHQEEYIGHINNMFQAFKDEWVKRWDKHLHVSDSFWSPLEDFVTTAFPSVPSMPYERITKEQWYAAIRHKKARAAVGTDGVSRADLLHMPVKLTERLLDIFHRIEDGEAWPSQLIQGWVIALEKTARSKQRGTI